MPTIARLSATAVDYLIEFDCHAIAISPTGKVCMSANPAGAAEAWSCRCDDAVKLARGAQATGDVEGVAMRLRINSTPHERVLEHMAERTARLDEALQHAQDAGLLKQFNASYRTRRLNAQRTGRRFMTYGTAQRRLS